MTETRKPLTLLLADDHGIVREGIAAFCGARSDLEIVAQCSNGAEAVEMIIALEPDFAVLDLNMPGMGGLEAIRRVRSMKSATRILVLSINREERVVNEAFRSGADGYLLKDGPARHLFDAIHYVLDGGQYLTPLIRRETLEQKGEEKDLLAQLSRREYEVFTFLVDGMRPKDIATALQLSPKTVDTYRANIMRKLEVDGIAEMVRFAIKQNLNSGNAMPD